MKTKTFNYQVVMVKGLLYSIFMTAAFEHGIQSSTVLSAGHQTMSKSIIRLNVVLEGFDLLIEFLGFSQTFN